MKALVYGNGESRNDWDITKSYKGFTTWGCNAIYRDCKVDNLVAIDYEIQQEIYKSGYPIKNDSWFADWSVLEGFDPGLLKVNYRPTDIHETLKRNNNSGYGWYDRKNCVVQGKERETAEKNYQEIITKFPHLNKEDVKSKCFKNVGIYITWLEDKDKIQNIERPKNWCAGTTAMHLACQNGADEVYMLGFDLSDSDEPLNNIYKGTDNYLSSDSKGFNTDEWVKQLITVFKNYEDTQFYWVVDVEKKPLECNNVKSISYEALDKVCNT
tara:strand:- start:9 stop:815 length:807 start_codon:yes stop_codon:yes gene_type:complete